jgi:GTP-binding protein LepA
MMQTGALHMVERVGVLTPKGLAVDELGPGEVGFINASIKTVADTNVGDTITEEKRPTDKALPGFKPSVPVVFCGMYPVDAADFEDLRDSLEKLRLNDASFQFEAETSAALGFGFRCGFLGLLHLEIITERLEREFGIDLISTAPSVTYEVVTEDGKEYTVTNPSEFPTGAKIASVTEPMVAAGILAPKDYVGTIMELCQSRRGTLLGMEYLGEDRVEIKYTMPLGEIVFDFFDNLKSKTAGYASLDYEPSGDQEADLVKVDILLQGEAVDAFSAIVHREKAYAYGVLMTERLKKLIPRQQFEVPIQAAIGARIIARESISAMRKDVLAKCYGGDITRKRKLLEKQKEGKKRMKMVGRVEVPQEAFIAALSGDTETKKDKK